MNWNGFILMNIPEYKDDKSKILFIDFNISFEEECDEKGSSSDNE